MAITDAGINAIVIAAKDAIKAGKYVTVATLEQMAQKIRGAAATAETTDTVTVETKEVQARVDMTDVVAKIKELEQFREKTGMKGDISAAFNQCLDDLLALVESKE